MDLRRWQLCIYQPIRGKPGHDGALGKGETVSAILAGSIDQSMAWYDQTIH